MMNHIHKTAVAMQGGNTLFAIKAAVLTGKAPRILAVGQIDLLLE
jgi:hypothetical protein